MDENSFAELMVFIEDLKINQTAEYTKTVTENDIKPLPSVH